jgi:hypothetical protein
MLCRVVQFQAHAVAKKPVDSNGGLQARCLEGLQSPNLGCIVILLCLPVDLCTNVYGLPVDLCTSVPGRHVGGVGFGSQYDSGTADYWW